MLTDAESFVREYTRPQQLEFVPEVQLYLAELIVPLWQATEWRAAAPQPPPFWAFAWPGSQALARFVFDNPDLVSRKAVLDFGAGSGLAAIAAARCDARTVIACDLDPLAAVAQRLNFALNRVSVTGLTSDYVGHTSEVVLAGDVCYEREPAERTMQWLRETAKTSIVLMADPGRHYAPSEGLELLATYDVPVLKDLESVDVKRTHLWRVS